MSRQLIVYPENVGGIPRVQVGEFEQVLSEMDSTFLSALTFAGVNPQGATLGMLCPNREVKSASSEFSALGGRVVSSPSASRKRICRYFGSSPLIVRGLDRESLAGCLVRAWEYSPLVWGIRAVNAPETFALEWLDQETTPTASFVEGWLVLLVSFYHGAWVGFYDGAPDRLSIVSRIATANGYGIEQSLEPL